MPEKQNISEARFFWRPFRPITNWWIWKYRGLLSERRSHPVALVKTGNGKRYAMLIHQCPSHDDPDWTMSHFDLKDHSDKKIASRQIRDMSTDRVLAGYD